MDSYEKFYHCPITYGKDEKIYIDLDLLKIILELEKPNEQISPKQYQDMFQSVFRYCIAKGSYPWKNPDNIIGETLNHDIVYSKDAIEEKKEEIISLLNQLKPLERYEDLMYLKDGQQWTRLRQQIGFLMTLANAAGLLSFEQSNLELSKKDDNNPKLVRKKGNE